MTHRCFSLKLLPVHSQDFFFSKGLWTVVSQKERKHCSEAQRLPLMFSLPCWPTTSSAVNCWGRCVQHWALCPTTGTWNRAASLPTPSMHCLWWSDCLHAEACLEVSVVWWRTWFPSSCVLFQSSSLLSAWKHLSLHPPPAAKTNPYPFPSNLQFGNYFWAPWNVFSSLHFPISPRFLVAACHPHSTCLCAQLRNSCRGWSAAGRCCWQRKKKRERAAEHLPRQKQCGEDSA